MNMNKIFLFVVLLMCAAFSGVAQRSNTSPQLSIGGEFGMPTGQLSSVYGTAFGASIKLEVPVIKQGLSFTVTGGVNAYLLKFYYAGTLHSATYVPLELGGKYYFSKVAYVEGDAGLSFNENSSYPASKTSFVYAPIIGVTAPTNHHKASIDLGLRLESRVESYRTVSQLALRLAYRFKI